MVTDYIDGHYGDIAAPTEPNAEFSEEPSSAPTAKISPAGTRDNSPGRESRDREANLNSEVPEGRPNPDPPKPAPMKSGPKASGPWDNPLLDHIVHQLQTGMSEREVAAQLARDIRSGTAPA